MILDGVPHCLADVGDGDIGGVNPLGVAVTESIGHQLFTLSLGVFAHRQLNSTNSEITTQCFAAVCFAVQWRQFLPDL